MIIFLIGPSCLFMAVEDWSFLDAIYVRSKKSPKTRLLIFDKLYFDFIIVPSSQ